MASRHARSGECRRVEALSSAFMLEMIDLSDSEDHPPTGTFRVQTLSRDQSPAAEGYRSIYAVAGQ